MKKAADVNPATTSSTSIGNIGNSAKEAKIHRTRRIGKTNTERNNEKLWD
jgi:hypothetical protein